MSKIFLLFLALAIPTIVLANPVSQSLQKLVNQAAGDLQKAVQGTTNTVRLTYCLFNNIYYSFEKVVFARKLFLFQ